ncbi:hypothetical protein ACFPZ4_22900, partial [Micromonospora harpali]
FTLPTMPVEDYPALPEMPESTGTVDAAAFAAADLDDALLRRQRDSQRMLRDRAAPAPAPSPVVIPPPDPGQRSDQHEEHR